MKETGKGGVMVEVRRHLGSKTDLVLFRNQSGFVPASEERNAQRYGLAPGASDLIGLHHRIITTSDVGLCVGRFVALEIKAPGRKPDAEQQRFIDLIRRFGGAAGYVDSVDGAEEFYLGLHAAIR